jgi:hypothetical protein
MGNANAQNITTDPQLAHSLATSATLPAKNAKEQVLISARAAQLTTLSKVRAASNVTRHARLAQAPRQINVQVVWIMLT